MLVQPTSTNEKNQSNNNIASIKTTKSVSFVDDAKVAGFMTNSEAEAIQDATDDGAEFELHFEADTTSPALHRAVCSGDSHHVLHVLQQLGGADGCGSEREVKRRHGHTQYTYLHLVCMVAEAESEQAGNTVNGCAASGGCPELKCVPMIYQLSNAGADVNAQDSRGCTPLSMAINKSLIHIMVALIRCGVDLCDRDYQALVRDTESPQKATMLDILDRYHPGMWAAVGSGSTGVVNLLLNSWCRVNIYKHLISGDMPLLVYAQRGKQPEDLVSLLDDYQVTLEFVHATLAGDEIRMQDLLMDSKPCDVNIMDISHQESSDGPLIPQSLREAAISLGHTRVLHLLPEGEHDNTSLMTPTSLPVPTSHDEAVSTSGYSSTGSNFESMLQKALDPNSLKSTLPDSQFMTINTSFSRAPRMSTFRSDTVATNNDPDCHYVQGFFFKEPEPPMDYVFKTFQPQCMKQEVGGSVRSSNGASGAGKQRSMHDYSKNWDAINGESKKKNKNKTKSKLCVIM